MKHLDEQVERAIIALCDALCEWERATGRQSALIIREAGGYVFRAMSGKPNVPDDVSDERLISITNGIQP